MIKRCPNPYTIASPFVAEPHSLVHADTTGGPTTGSSYPDGNGETTRVVCALYIMMILLKVAIQIG